MDKIMDRDGRSHGDVHPCPLGSIGVTRCYNPTPTSLLGPLSAPVAATLRTK